MKQFRYIGLIILCMLAFVQQTQARLIEIEGQEDPNWIGNYDVTSPAGTEFWATFMSHNNISENDPTLKLSIHAVADTTVNIIIEVNGTERGRIELIKDVKPKDSYVFSYDEYFKFNNVYIPAKDAFTPLPRGVHIYAEDHKTPFSCYAYSEAGSGQGTTRASTILLPTHILGEQYFVQTYQNDIHATEFAVVATENSTNVKIIKKSGEEETVPTLQKGQVYMVRSDLAEGSVTELSVDLSGSRVCADKPVAVFQGNDYAKIVPGNTSTGSFSGNHVFNQAFPIAQLGTEYYVALTEHANYNVYNILATEDGTVVNVTGKPALALNAGESLVEAYVLSSLPGGVKFVKITASRPIMVTHYLTCGGANPEATATGISTWGNPTSATVTSWDKRAKTQTFYTQEIEPEFDQEDLKGVCHMYAQVITKASDINTFTLDGVAVPGSSFVIQGDKAVANYEVPTEGKHILETTGDGFVGLVYVINSEARAYEYTMGLKPIPLYDSLFVTQTEKIMSKCSYNLERTPKGWYQRQLKEWMEPRLDTAVVCDSSTVNWAVYIPSKKPIEQIEWVIENLTDKNQPMIDSVPPGSTGTICKFDHRFILPYEKDLRKDKKKEKDKRHRYYDYAVQAILHRNLEKCDLEDFDIDTLRMVVRVKRIYNDTIYKVICSDDTIKFFKDTMPGIDPYETTFYCTPPKETLDYIENTLPERERYKCHLGENIIMRHYLTDTMAAGCPSFGCDSFVYLHLFVCQSYHDTLELTLCQDKLEGLNDRLGEFFSEPPYNGDFVTAFENIPKTGNWTQLPDNSWTFNGTSKKTTSGCFSMIPNDYFNKGNVNYSGCDSTLTLKLRVIPMEEVPTTAVVCAEPYVWKDKDGIIMKTFTSAQIGGKNKHYRDTISHKYSSVCNDCPRCDSIVYTLDLMFADMSGIDIQEEHVCQNKPKTITHSDATGYGEWTFTVTQPWAKAGSRIEGVIKEFTTADNCTYKKQVVFIVDSVLQQYDTIVGCYTDATGGIYRYDWPGHNQFWYRRKDGATTPPPPTRCYSFFTTGYPTDGRRHYYDLIDTLKTGECEEIYYCHVIVMPNYVLDLPPHNMTVEEYFEFGNKIYAGPEATNLPSGKTIERLGMGEWPLTTSGLKTKPQYQGDAGCDSVVSVLLRIGQAFADTTYAYACGQKTYIWQDDRYPNKPHTTNIIDENGNHFNGAINVPQVTVPTVFHYYDSLKTKYPVPELDSIWVLSLTVFPSFFDTTYVSTCQDSAGYNWVDHMGADHDIFINGTHVGEMDSIPALRTGVYIVEDRLQTYPRDFIHPLNGTIITEDIVCDSIYTLYLTVNTTYTDEFQKVEYDRTLKSNDTLTFFTEPVQLFIGEDYDFAGHHTSLSAFYTQFGTDNVHIITDDDTTFVEGAEDRHIKSQFGCDSTTFLNISLCRLIKYVRTDSIGDNDTIWHFGGTQTPLEGEIYHSQPYVTSPQVIKDSIINRYGRPIDRTSTTRPVYTFHFVDSMTSVNGCDSIEDRYLAVFPTYFYQETDTICHTEDDPTRTTWRDHKDLNLLVGDEETGTVYVNDTLFTYRSNEDGAKFDSILSLAVTILPGVLWYGHRTICMNDTFMWYGSNVYYDPELHFDLDSVYVEYTFDDAVYACGRKYHMDLTIDTAYGYTGGANYMDYVTDTVMCQYDEFHWYDKNGNEHRGNLSDPQGNKYDLPPTGEVGWFTIYDSLKTHDCGCDSIYTLRYYVDRAYQFFTDTALCEGDVFEWEIDNGVDPPFIYNSYTADSVYQHITDVLRGESMSHCDSSYYLNIHVEGPVTLHLEDTLCYEDSAFVFDGIMHRDYTALIKESHSWSKPRVFEDTLYTVTKRARCDSTVYLRLTIGPSADSTWRDTICIGETFHLYGKELTQPGVYQYTLQNEFGCTSDYYLTLDVLPPTEFEISTEPLCVNKTGVDNTYELHYTYSGEFGPLTYSVLYDDKALALGFEDFTGEPITIPADEHVAGEQHTLHIPVPEFYEKEEFPKPDLYHAVIKFDNGVCLSDSLMTYPFAFRIDYPDWITEQRHGDLIAILNDQYNGGYVWTDYQWYQGDSLLVGQTKPYLYIPTGLEVGEEYHVELIREGDSIAFPTCPITIIENPVPDDYAPKQGYLAVTPTCIVPGNPYITILSRKDGTYRITSVEGHFISEGAFQADATRVPVPSTEGMYIVQLWSNDTPEEPYRAIKIIVQSACPKCDISSF